MTVRIPKSWPIYVIKCVWPSTAIFLTIPARDEEDALERAWKRMNKTEGGDKCLSLAVKEIRWSS